MKLNLKQLRQITLGAVDIKEENGAFSFDRFTKEQKNLYRITNQDFYNKTFMTAGVKFSFKTDSKNLFIKLKTSNSSTRRYFSVDVFVNKSPIGYIDNFSGLELMRDYTQQEFLQGEFSGHFELGDGEKQVCVHLPWSANASVEEFSIDDNSFIEDMRPKRN